MLHPSARVLRRLSAASLTQTLLFENLLTFNDGFGAHGINAVAGYTEQLDEGESLGAFREQYTDEGLRVIDAGTSRLNNRGGRQQHTLRSFLGRASYNYDGRYLLTASARRDGSSRFGSTNRWGTFLSGSAGWVMSEESQLRRGCRAVRLPARAEHRLLHLGVGGRHEPERPAESGLVSSTA